jgi:hypothetical protein
MPEMIKINAIIFCKRICSPRRIVPRKKATTGIK